MTGFSLLWQKILRSSIWVKESKETRLVWIAMLAMKDKDGMVHSSVIGLADAAKVAVEECEIALEVLLSPDPHDSSGVDEGRRIREIQGGWEIVNNDLYRFSTEAKREFWRQSQAEYRAEKKKVDEPEKVINGEKKTKKSDFSEDSKKVLTHLNQKTGRNFRETGSSLEPIQKRLSYSDVTVDGVFKMIDRQVLLWKGDSKMEEYLRPSTLFRERNFNEYYAARELPVNQSSPENSRNPVRSLGNSVFALREIIKAKESQCADLRLKHCSEVAMGDSWTNEESKKKYLAIKKEIKELNGKIASTQP